MISYYAAISACKTSKDQWQMDLKLLAEMRTQDIQPGVLTYNAAISVCEKSTNQRQTA